MRRLFLLPVAALIFSYSCNNASQSNSATIEADTVMNAVDTATALPDTVAKVAPKVDEGPRLDSLASAETTLEFMKNSGHWDEYQQGIIPSIMQQNLDYARRLLRNRHKYFIIADKGSMHVILYDKYGREVKSYLMACSRYYGTKHKRRDNRTPEGFFTAQGVYNSTDWLYTNDDGYTSPARGQFGPRFIRLNTPVSMQIGIHGTSSVNSPGRRVSHGCMRLRNENILDLVKYASAGMPIIVNPSDRDQQVNKEEGYDVVKLDLGKEPYGSEKKKDEKKDKEAEKAKADSTATKAAAADSIAVKAPESVKADSVKKDSGKKEEKPAESGKSDHKAE